jgi:hypothetical protein
MKNVKKDKRKRKKLRRSKMENYKERIRNKELIIIKEMRGKGKKKREERVRRKIIEKAE